MAEWGCDVCATRTIDHVEGICRKCIQHGWSATIDGPKFGEVNSDMILNPDHYVIAKEELGLETWDILDHYFSDDPLKWNAGKYLLRAGRKEGNSEVQDLRKLIQYVERRIDKIEN